VENRSGNIPVFTVEGANIPETWEKAILAVWDGGADARTEYDKRDMHGNFLDPPSRDATVIAVVADPFAEPRIHKNIPSGPEELEVYRQEVVNGIHDHWVDPSDPDKWTYTYHGRLFHYVATDDLQDPEAARLRPVDQIAYVVDKLSQTPFTRRAQAITWMPSADPPTEDPPCLQRMWFRMLRDSGGRLVLNLNTHWRSRDGYKAWLMNVFALTDLMRVVAERIAAKAGEPVRVGRYVDLSDSFHIYGSYFSEVEAEVAKMRAQPDVAQRAWRSDHPALVMMFEEARRKLAENPDFMRR
jgi:thymidylate synthase